MFNPKSLFKPLLLTMALAGSAIAGDFDGKRVLFIDSYHAGYEWSDGVTAGVERTLQGSGVELKVFRMDTKRNKEDAFKQEAAQKAKAEIDSFKPDVVIAADDNASKFLIQPFYKDAALPFVFCGVNWDESVYGYPYKNVTGMVEVSGVKELVGLLQQFAKGGRIGLLAEDSLTERKEAENYKSKLGIEVQPAYIQSFAEWKQKFTEMQDQVDILIIGNTAGLPDFDEQAATAHALANAKIPSGAVQTGPMSFALVGYLKVAEEQGSWAAESALKILGGTSPADIPITRNKDGKIVINLKMAEASGIDIPYSLIETATLVMQ
ncbi:MAG: hypothetical protein H6964_05910 [Chromatiaceae bacterium]|nr:hypothetical protein [Gammaproteobacteria bacterium]MCP5426701.1 hypothetical protein [Chromatiaceae bacterium]MCB1861499.1 hypothetical protein [Gammaproteobacteria bacterium]MCB1873463.1 hypothetical protein [Gammaproteobacteria bacterium]MCB1879042.1 hypothetical protein [Gammaproteobacteria bacterium]